jgi:DNA-binding IclR family transcriptional regulator
MADLARAWNETVNLEVLRDDHTISIEHARGQHRLGLVGDFPGPLPAHCTSTGKVLLAYAGRSYVEANIPASLTRYTQKTIATRAELLDELEQVKRRGFATSMGEYEESLHAVGAPIRQMTGEVVAAVSISGPVSRMGEEMMGQMVKDLLEAVSAISARLGYRER